MAIGSDSVVVGFFSVGVRLGFRRDSSESDDNRVESGQILSNSDEIRQQAIGSDRLFMENVGF